MGFFLPIIGVIAGVKILGNILGFDEGAVNQIIESGNVDPIKKALKDKYGIQNTDFLEDEDGVSDADIALLKMKGVPDDVVEIVKKVFGNKINVNVGSVFKTNIVDIVKTAVEKIINTIDKLINLIDINKDNFEKLINGIFDIVKIFMNQIKELNNLLPITLLLGLVSPLFFLIAKFVSVF